MSGLKLNHVSEKGPQGARVTEPTFSVYPIFLNDPKAVYLYKIAFIFDRRHHSWAAGTFDKYKHDFKYVPYAFAKSKISHN